MTGSGAGSGDILSDLGLDAAKIAQRKAFLDLTDADVTHLAEFHRRLEEAGECAFFVEEFYRHLQAFPETARFIGEPSVLRRLRAQQAEYFHSLTAGAYGTEYVRHRLRVGLAHERIGLAPQWYLGAYSKYLTQLVPKVRQLYPGEAERAEQTILALLKIVYFDMDLAIETYIHAKERTIEAKVTQLEALGRIAVSINSALSQDEVLDEVMRFGMELTGARAACVAFFDEQTASFSRWVARGLSDRFVNELSIRQAGLADEAFAADSTVIVSNDRPDTRHRLSVLAREEGILGFICLPLVSHTSRLGVIYFYRDDRDTFTADEISLLRTFASLSAGAIEEARLREKLEALARTDTLTGLFNRRVFDRRLEDEHRRAQRYVKPYSLMLIDIDHFKRVNDDYGHSSGDAVLTAVAQRLAGQSRDVDILARYGGEEFVVIMPEIGGTGARPVAERIRSAVAAAPFRLPDGREIAVTVSIGIACFPECADSAPGLVDRADQALYTAKEAGRNRVVLYRTMLKAQIEAQPERVVELLNESLDNMWPLVTALDNKAAFLRSHGHCVQRLARRLGQALGVGRVELESLTHAALLHDLGIIAVPDAVVQKSSSLAEEEWSTIRRHPVTAARWLERVAALRSIAPIVRHHHERYDGGGYPDGLSGAAIPRLARILAVADAWCAMRAERPHRRALVEADARAVIEAGAGRQFDPEVVAVFLELPGED